MYLDKELKKLNQKQWELLLGLPEYANVAKTCVSSSKREDFEVVTIWVGYDMGGEAKVFGTRVFVQGHTHDLSKWKLKYRSLKEALAGHNSVCDDVKKGLYNEEELLKAPEVVE